MENKKLRSKKCQGAIEFLVLFAGVMFFIVVFFGVIQKNTADRDFEKKQILLQNAALSVRDEINLASGSSEGYYREFRVPEKILGQDYFMNVTEGNVYASMPKIGFAYRVSNVTGNLTKGMNNITKQGGVVLLNGG